MGEVDAAPVPAVLTEVTLVDAAKPLTAKQQEFVRQYLVDRNATQAAIRAGYSDNPDSAKTEGWRLLTNADVQAALARSQHALAERVGITAEMVVSELRKLGFANMLDYLDIRPDGEAIINLAAVTPDQAAAIVEYTVEEYTEGKGKDARDVKRTKLKLADKRAALGDLGKHLGLFRDGGGNTAVIVNLRPDDANL